MQSLLTPFSFYIQIKYLLILLAFIFLYVLKKYINGGFCTLTRDLTSKIIIITGSNGGIGKFAAQKLAEMGGIVIMACRDISKVFPFIFLI